MNKPPKQCFLCKFWKFSCNCYTMRVEQRCPTWVEKGWAEEAYREYAKRMRGGEER